jgi:NAD(P)H-flavin reductase
MASEGASPVPASSGTGGPKDPYVPVPYRVVENSSETPDTVTLTLHPVGGTRVPSFLPGQFNMFYAFGIGEAAISMSGDPHVVGRLVHTVRAVGKVTTALTRLRPGDVAGIRGPYGHGWPLEVARGRDVVIVAGGLGLAPLRPLVYQILRNRDHFGRVEIVYGARTPSDLLYYGEIQEWRKRSDLRFQVTVDSADRSWYGDVGVVTSRLPDARFDPSRAIAFVCGPEIMMKFTAQALEARGLSDEAIWLSMERNMKCAFAQCGHCQFGPHFICRDGPVLPYTRIRRLMALREV